MRGGTARAALALLLLAGCSTSPPEPATESLPRFMDEFFFQWVQRDPEWFSELRPFGDDVDPYGGLLSDVSLPARRENLAFAGSALSRLRRYDLRQADPELRAAAEALEWHLDDLVRAEPFLLHDYPVNPYDGDHLRLIDFMTDVHVIRSARDARNYLERLSALGPRVDTLVEEVRARAARGVIPPRPTLRKVRSGLEAFTAEAPEQSALVTSFRARLGALDGDAGLDARARDALLAEAIRQVEASVLPAYRRLAAEVARLEPGAPEEAGVWRLPDGDAYYAYLVRHYTTLEIGPEAIHQLGRAEVERVQTELSDILRALGFEHGSFGERMRAYRDDFPQTGAYFYPDTPSGRVQALEDYRRRVQVARRQFLGVLGTLPEVAVRVEPVPRYREEGATATTYVPPSLDGHRPGIFYVNLGGGVFRPPMQTLVHHETIPGHHVQQGRQRASESLPTFSRVVTFTAFAEGWAFYAERLAYEAGVYEDAHAAVSHLGYELLRAARLVVDTGIHHRRWSRSEALDWMRRELGSAQEAQVDRYIVRPGEALAYKMGELHLLELRRRARQALGPRFDPVRFHDAVLRHGSLPLAVLERAVERWLREAL